MGGYCPRAWLFRTADARRRTVLWAAMAAPLIGCQSSPPQSTTPTRAAASEPNPRALSGAAQQSDESYDWHALLIAPFGSVLKAVPLALHEVLLFRDESLAGGAEDAAAGAPAAGAADCYAADTPAPPFAGRTPDEYVLCFTRDRLARIQVSVRLKAVEAPGVFAAACAAWLKNATPAAELPASETQNAAASAVGCVGRDGAVRFSGRLEEAADRSEMPPAELTMSITLESVPP